MRALLRACRPRLLHTSVLRPAAKVSPAELTKILSERIANFKAWSLVISKGLSVEDRWKRCVKWT